MPAKSNKTQRTVADLEKELKQALGVAQQYQSSLNEAMAQVRALELDLREKKNQEHLKKLDLYLQLVPECNKKHSDGGASCIWCKLWAFKEDGYVPDYVNINVEISVVETELG